MGANDATVIVGTLSDEQLVSQINKLVNTVDSKTKAMSKSFDNFVDHVNNRMKEIGNIKIDSGTVSDSGSTKAVNKQKELEQQTKRTTEAVKEQNLTLDQTAQALQKAAAKKSASDSYAVILKNMRENVGLLKLEIKDLENIRLEKQAESFRKFEQPIRETRERINELRRTLNDMANDPNASRLVKTQTANELIALEQKLISLQREQSQENTRIAQTFGQVIMEKRAQYDKEKQDLISLSAGERERSVFIKEQTAELGKQLNAINEINNSKSAKGAFESISAMPTNTIEQATEKLEALQALKQRVANTPLFSDRMNEKLNNSIKATEYRIEGLGKVAKEEAHVVSDSVARMNQAIRRNIQLKNDERIATQQAGLAAQESYRRLVPIIKEQAELSGGKSAIGIDAQNNINYIEQLRESIVVMRRAYYEMDTAQRESPIGVALKNDIEQAQKIRNEIDKFNRQVSGIKRPEEGGAKNDEQLGSYKRLSTILTELTNKYRELGREQRNSSEGQELIRKIQLFGREVQKVQQQMSRPISLKSALGLSENTLDDIAYKMRQLQAYRQGIDLTKPTAASEINQVDSALKRLQVSADSWMNKQKGMVEMNNTLGRSWNYMKNRLAFYFTVGASTQFVKNLIEIRSQYEMNEKALGILIDSAERGTQVFRELSNMALMSPYTLIELSNAARQLTAYDVAAKDVVDTTRRLADMTAAVGIPVERLTYALGQIKAYSYLNARDARMFANAGIPLVKELSKYYTELEGKLVSTADIYDRIKKKAIGYNDVMSVMTKMTDEGGKFFDFQAKMAETLKVQLANLTLAWNNMLNDIGASEQGVLSGGIKLLKTLFLNWKEINKVVTTLVGVGGSLIAISKLANFAIGKNTQELIKNIAATENATAADYKNIASKESLTKARARYLVAMNSENKALIAQIVNTKALTAAQAESIARSGSLGKMFYTIQMGAAGAGKAINGLVASFAKLAPAMLGLLAISAIVDIFVKIANKGDEIQELNKQLVENAKNSAKQIKDTLDDIQSIYKENGVKDATELKLEDQKKAWETLREQIELSAASANQYIQILLQEDNMGKRVSEAEAYLKKVQRVHDLMALWKEDAIEVTEDFKILGIGADGLTEDLKDFTKYMDKSKFSTEELNDMSSGVEGTWRQIVSWVYDYSDLLQKAGVGLAHPMGYLKEIGGALGLDFLDPEKAKLVDSYKEVSSEVEPLARSLMENLKRDGITNAREIQEAISKILDAAATKEQWSDTQKLNARILLEQQMRNSGNEIFAESVRDRQASWDAWMKFLMAHHKSEFQKMGSEEISQEKWAQDRRKKLYEETYKKFQEYNRLAADDIRDTVNSLSQLKVHIKVLYDDSEAEKSVYQTLEEMDKKADDNWTVMQRLNKRIKELQDKGVKAATSGEQYYLATKEEKELTDAIAQKTAAQKDYNDAVAAGGHSKKEDAAGAKAQKAAESELQKAIKEELQLIDNVRNAYKKMDEEGVGHFEAVQKSTSGLEESIKHVNSVLSKYGIGRIDFSKFAGVQNPRAIIDMLNKQIDNLLRSGVAKPEEVKDLEIKVSSMKLDVTSFDQKTITESLNSELARLKDEYELSVALDADPELGDMFANWIGFDPSLLTSSVQEYANEYTRLLNKYLKEKGSDLELPSLDLTDDDIREFERMVKDNTMNKEWVEAIKKGVTEIRNLRRKDAEDTSKEWNKLIEKYGGLQAKMVKIYKDTVNEQINIAKKFGSNEEITAALDLSRRINISQDPEEIARLQTELSKIMDKVVENNPKAINVYTATQNKQGKETAKANWEDFKDSNLYAMTFEDMENVSTRAIKSIIDKLDDLKDKVGEDPASMKALVKSIEDARKELEKRNPFAAIVQGNKEWKDAVKELEQAQKELEQANKRVDGAKIALDNAKAAGSTEDVAAAQEKLDKALNERASAEEKVIKAENKMQKANGKIISGLQNLSGKLNDIKGLFDTVSQLFREFGGDDGTADAIDEISKGFTIMTTIIMGVVAAMILLETTQPWLLAIAAALSVIVGLVSFLSGQHNKNIDKKVKASELAVKRLENAYIDLEQAADRAYGTATIGAQKAMLANKELQLAELRRQLQLERSRKSKDRDQDKIEDLKKQIKELEYEISNGTKKIVDDLLGVSSAGSFAEDLVSSMIESFRQGEDYMKVFEEKFEDMIDNMIMKAIVSRVVSSYIDKLWDNLDQQIAQRSKAESDAYAAAQAKNSTVKNMTDEEMKWMMMAEGMKPTYGFGFRKEEYDAYRKAAQESEDAAKKRLEAAETFTDSDMDYVMAQIAEIMPELGEKLKSIIGEYYKFGDKAENATLSALQQGIQGVTESTAEALEAYMNGVSQQVYLQSSILMEIRDVVVGMNGDVGLGVQAQMLLQLQQSYVVQTAIQNILAGVVNPSGRAFSVEIIS